MVTENISVRRRHIMAAGLFRP